MSVTSFTVKDHTASVTITDKIVRTYQVVYQAVCNDQNDGPVTCMQHASAPSVGSYYSVGNDSDAGATFKGYDSVVRADVDSQLPVWLLTAKFDTTFQQTDRDVFDDDSPLDERAKWSGSFFTAQKATDRWEDGTPIENSAKEPLNLDVDDSRPTIVVSKNFATIDLLDLYEYRDAVNSGSFWGFGKGKLKIANITWSHAFFNGAPYFPVTVEVHVNLDGWAQDFVDEGYRELIAGVAKTILDDTTLLPVRERVYLDGAGRKLPDGDPIEFYPDPKKHVYKLKNFNAIGIPTTLFGA